MNGNGIGVRSVDSRRVKQIGDESVERPATPPRESIREMPPDELNNVRSGNSRNSTPNNSAGFTGLRVRFWRRHGKVIDALRIKVDVDTALARESLQQFG